MSDTPNKWIKVTDQDENGRYKFTYTADSANSVFNYAVLETKNKFVDRDIVIQALVGSGTLQGATGHVNLSQNGAPALLGASTTSVPSQLPYLQISGSGQVKVSTAGWINADTTVSSQEDIIYYPINSATFNMINNEIICTTAGYISTGTTAYTVTATTVTTNYSMTGHATYLTKVAASEEYDIEIIPQYTASAGIISTTTNQNNGGKEYWRINTSAINVTTTTVDATNNILTSAGLSWNAGWVTAGYIGPARFSATYAAAAGERDDDYVDISETNDAPVLVSGGYLYVNEGYTSKVKISLAQLVPDKASITGTQVGADYFSPYMLKNITAYDKDGKLFTGNIESLSSRTIMPTTTTQTITAGVYLAGDQTIVGDPDLKAANIVYNKNIFGVTGAFSRQTANAITSSVILENYVGYVNGKKVTGAMETRTVSVTYASISLNTYFNTTTSSTGSISIVPQYTVAAGYVEEQTNATGTANYYNIKTTNLQATVSCAPTGNNKTYTTASPFLSIYDTTNSRGIQITTAVNTANVGTDKAFIQIKNTGSAFTSANGWITTQSTTSTSNNTYICMNLYRGSYSPT